MPKFYFFKVAKFTEKIQIDLTTAGSYDLYEWFTKGKIQNRSYHTKKIIRAKNDCQINPVNLATSEQHYFLASFVTSLATITQKLKI